MIYQPGPAHWEAVDRGIKKTKRIRDGLQENSSEL